MQLKQWHTRLTRVGSPIRRRPNRIKVRQVEERGQIRHIGRELNWSPSKGWQVHREASIKLAEPGIPAAVPSHDPPALVVEALLVADELVQLGILGSRCRDERLRRVVPRHQIDVTPRPHVTRYVEDILPTAEAKLVDAVGIDVSVDDIGVGCLGATLVGEREPAAQGKGYGPGDGYPVRDAEEGGTDRPILQGAVERRGPQDVAGHELGDGEGVFHVRVGVTRTQAQAAAELPLELYGREKRIVAAVIRDPDHRAERRSESRRSGGPIAENRSVEQPAALPRRSADRGGEIGVGVVELVDPIGIEKVDRSDQPPREALVHPQCEFPVLWILESPVENRDLRDGKGSRDTGRGRVEGIEMRRVRILAVQVLLVAVGSKDPEVRGVPAEDAGAPAEKRHAPPPKVVVETEPR